MREYKSIQTYKRSKGNILAASLQWELHTNAEKATMADLQSCYAYVANHEITQPASWATMAAVLVSLCVFYASIREGFPTKWSPMRVLSVTCLVNPVVLAIATLMGTTGAAAVLPFGLGFFLLSYLRVYRDAIPYVIIERYGIKGGSCKKRIF